MGRTVERTGYEKYNITSGKLNIVGVLKPIKKLYNI